MEANDANLVSVSFFFRFLTYRFSESLSADDDDDDGKMTQPEALRRGHRPRLVRLRCGPFDSRVKWDPARTVIVV
jgi:hypothetical protein